MARDVEADTQAVDMARYLVERMAPDELELFEETAAVVIRRAPRGGRRGDDPLGFGVVEVSGMLFTTVACGVAREVLESLAKEAGHAAAGRIRSRFRFRRTPATQSTDRETDGSATARSGRIAAGALSPGLLDEVRGLAQHRAELLGLPPDRAEMLAESVVGYLSAAPGQPG